MGELNFTIKVDSGSYTRLDKEYKDFINETLNKLDEEETHRWEIYNLIMSELLNSGLYNVFEEVKYRLTDGENPNEVMLDIIDRKEYSSSIIWFLKNRIESYLDEDFLKRFYD